MATVNVYVPDKLKGRLEGSGVNLSATARQIWERELSLGERDPSEFHIDTYDTTGAEIELNFNGSRLVRGAELGQDLYLTTDDELVFIGEEEYYTCPRSEVDANVLWNWFRNDSDAYAAACYALGVKRVVQL